jgi:hypothetical protein
MTHKERSNQIVGMMPHLPEDASEVLRRLLIIEFEIVTLAERELCARLAETQALFYQQAGFESKKMVACQHLAQAIRDRKGNET